LQLEPLKAALANLDSTSAPKARAATAQQESPKLELSSDRIYPQSAEQKAFEPLKRHGCRLEILLGDRRPIQHLGMVSCICCG